MALQLPALGDNSGAESVCNKLYTSKVPLLIFLCESSRCGAHLLVFAWNTATFPVRRMRTLTLSRDGMALNLCHPALQRLTAMKSHFKNSGTYGSRFSCFPVINTFVGRFPRLICWGRQ